MFRSASFRKHCLLLASALWLASASSFAFELNDTANQPLRLADFKGKWVVVNFWATWCAPCVKEIPEIAEFSTTQGEKVRVIGIALDWHDGDKPTEIEIGKIKAFAKKVGHIYPLVLGNDASEKTFGKVKGLPKTIVYTPEGKVAYEKTGPITKALLMRVISGESVK